MELRLKILFDAKLINDEVYNGMLGVITRLEQQWLMNIRNAQGEMLITHMANAMMRARRQENIAPLDNDILAEVIQSKLFPQIKTINSDLLSEFSFPVSENEQSYLLANLYGLYESQSQ